MQDITIILQILWTSLATSTYYVLFAVAFALVLKVTRLFNFAQAAIMTIAFYTAFVVVQWLEWPAWAAFVVMMVVTLAASYALERIGFEALRGTRRVGDVRLRLHLHGVGIHRLRGGAHLRHLAADDLPDDLLAGDARRRYRGEQLGFASDGLHGRGACGVLRLHALHPHRAVHDRGG